MAHQFQYARLCAWLAAGACFIAAAAILTADFVVEGNDMFADTISAMAAGPDMWLAEIGIYVFAFAFFAIALGAAAAHPGGWAWSAATIGFIAIGVIVFLIGFRDEYGDADHMASENIHLELVYTLAGALAVTTFLASSGAKSIDRAAGTRLAVLGGVWVVMAPVFVFLPTGYDGIYERALGAVAVAIVLAVSDLLNRIGKNQSEAV